MKTYSDISINNFQFWSGAINSRNRFGYKEMEQIEYILEDIYPEGIEDVQLNDIFWFESETLCEWLGIDFDEWIERPDDYWVNND